MFLVLVVGIPPLHRSGFMNSCAWKSHAHSPKIGFASDHRIRIMAIHDQGSYDRVRIGVDGGRPPQVVGSDSG